MTRAVDKLKSEIEDLEARIEELLDKGQLPTKLMMDLQAKRKALNFGLELAG